MVAGCGNSNMLEDMAKVRLNCLCHCFKYTIS